MFEPAPMIEQADHRAKDYWFSDGIPALVFGAAYIVLFLELCAPFALLYSIRHIGNNWLWLWFSNSALVAFPVALFLSVQWFVLWHEDIIEFIKSRITYPRTGYVAPPSYWTEKEEDTDSPPNTLLGAVFRLIGRLPIFESGLGRRVRAWLWILFWAWLLGLFEPSWLPAKLRWVFIATLALPSPASFKEFRRKVANDKREWTKGLGFTLGVLVVFSFLWKQHPTFGVVLFLFSPGILLMLGGAIELTRYLRRNPLPRT
jgi:hypothetical protein